MQKNSLSNTLKRVFGCGTKAGASQTYSPPASPVLPLRTNRSDDNISPTHAADRAARASGHLGAEDTVARVHVVGGVVGATNFTAATGKPQVNYYYDYRDFASPPPPQSSARNSKRNSLQRNFEPTDDLLLAEKQARVVSSQTLPHTPARVHAKPGPISPSLGLWGSDRRLAQPCHEPIRSPIVNSVVADKRSAPGLANRLSLQGLPPPADLTLVPSSVPPPPHWGSERLLAAQAGYHPPPPRQHGQDGPPAVFGLDPPPQLNPAVLWTTSANPLVDWDEKSRKKDKKEKKRAKKMTKRASKNVSCFPSVISPSL